MRIQEVGEKAFAREVIRADRPVLVHFRAAWCKQSLQIGPIVESLASTMSSDVKVVQIDSQRSPKLCARLGVKRFPTQMLYADGVMVDQILGTTTAESLQKMIKTTVDTRKKKPPARAQAAEINDLSFGPEVLQSDIPVIVVFWEDGCLPSQETTELVGEIGETQKAKIKGKIKLLPVQVKRAPIAAGRLGVTRLPITMVFRDGVVMDTIGGALSRETVTKLVKTYAGR